MRVGFGTFRYPVSDSYNGFIDDAQLDGTYGSEAPALGERVSRN